MQCKKSKYKYYFTLNQIMDTPELMLRVFGD